VADLVARGGGADMDDVYAAAAAVAAPYDISGADLAERARELDRGHQEQDQYRRDQGELSRSDAVAVLPEAPQQGIHWSSTSRAAR
jgi:hypothetical protein